EEIAREVQARWPIKKIALVHRTVRLRPGEVSVAIAVASPHRHDAFEACRFAIDTLKETVPIWKKEFFVDGEAWVEGVIPRVEKGK
ncbi:MAG: molybdenum cofactor biosynthesis protein MoaE, partial [Calditrichaeota bacterium]